MFDDEWDIEDEDGDEDGDESEKGINNMTLATRIDDCCISFILM
jgi:hypothetical protein